MDEASPIDNTSAPDQSATANVELVYLPAERCRVLLEALQAASASPSDQVAALRSVINFLDADPAVRASGTTHPLRQLLAALPDLLRIAAGWNDVIEKLAAADAGLDDRAADAPMVRGEALREVIAFFDADDAVLRHGVTRPLKQILAEMHDGQQRKWGNRPTGLVDHHLRGVILFVARELIRLGIAPPVAAGRVVDRLGNGVSAEQLLRWHRDLYNQPRLTRDVYEALRRENPAGAAQGSDEDVIEGLLAMLGPVRNWA